MTQSLSNQQILEKAIQKAGYSDQYAVKKINGEPFVMIPGVFQNHYAPFHVLIFNHDFAKALWGEGKRQTGALRNGDIEYIVDWQYHLQQMVIADDPIAYLGANI